MNSNNVSSLLENWFSDRSFYSLSTINNESKLLLSAQVHALNLFKQVAKRVPAYKDFLKDNNVDLNDIKSYVDFRKLPLTNKRNYIEVYSLENRLYKDKNMSDYYMLCTSSGSTGEPVVWPRSYILDDNLIDLNYQMYKSLFRIDKKKTLVVVTFSLGAWTAGMLTSRLCWEASRKTRLSVVTPGLNKEVALKTIKQLSPYFDQIIITGYPPFIIDLLEYGAKHKFNFKSVNTKIHYTSARVSENLRRKIVKRISSSDDRYDILGFYACSETGIIGIETPNITDILVNCQHKKNLCKELFHDFNPPTLVEYNPEKKFVEVVNDLIVITVDQPIPLIRFSLGDRGGIINGNKMYDICKKHGVNVSKKIKSKHLLYIHGRADSVRILNNVYIEDIQYCLEQSKFANRFTGNFKYGLDDKGMKNRLVVHVHLKTGKVMSKEEKEEFIDEMYDNLLRVNADFKMVQEGIKIARFKVVFLPEDPSKYQSAKFKYFL